MIFSIVDNIPGVNLEAVTILSVTNVTPLIFLIRSFILGFSLIKKDKSNKKEYIISILINVIGYIGIVLLTLVSIYIYIFWFILDGKLH